MVRNLPDNVGDIEDMGLIPGLGRSPREGRTATHSSILIWKIPLTEEPGRGHKESDMTEHRPIHKCS